MKRSKVMSSKRVSKSNSSKEMLETSIAFNLVIFNRQVNLRVAVSVSDTEITVSVEIKSWHVE